MKFTEKTAKEYEERNHGYFALEFDPDTKTIWKVDQEWNRLCIYTEKHAEEDAEYEKFREAQYQQRKDALAAENKVNLRLEYYNNETYAYYNKEGNLTIIQKEEKNRTPTDELEPIGYISSVWGEGRIVEKTLPKDHPLYKHLTAKIKEEEASKLDKKQKK